MTEDEPLEYGGGSVIVWDAGRYTNLEHDDGGTSSDRGRRGPCVIGLGRRRSPFGTERMNGFFARTSWRRWPK